MMTRLLFPRLRSIALTGASLIVAAMSVPTARAQTTPQPILVADFNHDGIPDALVLSTTAPTATIAFGTVPYGTFGTGSRIVTFPSGCTSLPQGSVLTGDFNGDGLADIAFFCSDAAGVMLGNGDGTFGTPQMIEGVASGTAVAADFNKDGKLDLVVLGLIEGPSSTLGTLQYFAGVGDGTFGQAVTTTLDQATYSAPLAVDLNGDGFPEIALLNVVSGTPPSLNIFGNNQDGTFGKIAGGVATPNTGATTGSSASTIVAGNFFSATSVDLAVAGTGANGGFSVFQNTSSATAFSFNDPVTIPYAGLTAASAAIFTGSGFTDLVASNGTNIAALTNDGTGNFAATYTTLSVASTSALFAVADANGDGYSDIYTAGLPQSGALQLAVNVTSGTATATSQSFSLPIGSAPISAVWNGNVNLLGSTATGTQIVTGAGTVTTVISSKNPSIPGTSVTFSANVAPAVAGRTPTGTVTFTDGATTLQTVNLDDGGNASYATTTLAVGTHPITASYSGDNYFAISASPVLSQVVNQAVPVITWATPASIVYGTPLSATQLDATVAGLNGAALPGTFTYSPAAGAVLNPGTQTLSVTFVPTDTVGYTNATATVSLVVNAPTVAVTVSAPPMTPPGSQTSVTVALTQSYPVDLTGTLTIGFTRSSTPNITDPSLQFAAGGTTISFPIPAGTTTIPPIQLQVGTIAGTITVPLILTVGNTNVTPDGLAPVTIVVPTAVPTVSGMTVSRSGNQLTVVMHGFSNTREVASAQFHFTAAAGADIGTPDLTLTTDTIFNTNWFNTDASDAYGSTFTYTQIFNISDDATTVGSVEATLTNSVGASTMITAQ